MKNIKNNKNNKLTFWIQMFISSILYIYLLLRLPDLANNKIKFTLVSLCILIGITLVIISIIGYFKNKKIN